MKIICAIMMLVSCLNKNNLFFVSARKDLEEILQNQRHQDSLWIIGSLQDSFESEVLREMAQLPRWESLLQDWPALSLEEYQQIIKSHGFTILHSEVHREIVLGNILEYIPNLPVPFAEEEGFRSEFLHYAANSSRVYKQLLVQVEPLKTFP